MKTIFADANAGLIALLLFLFIFVGVALWAFKPSRKAQIESYKYIPVAEDSDE